MGFYIKKVTACSKKKGDASVEFGKGLNIIQGRSDSGKTCVANCINFIFGSKEGSPFKNTAEYDAVILVVASYKTGEEIILCRAVGENKVSVTSYIKEIESGVYDVVSRNGAKNPPLNNIWLKLIGISEDVMIVSNKHFEKSHLTWRRLLRIFYLDENRIDNADSIVEPQQAYVENTLFLSALLYLITGKTFSEIDAQEKTEIKKARREAVCLYVNGKKQMIKEKQIELEEQLKIVDGINVEARLEEVATSLVETQRLIKMALDKSQAILLSVTSAEEQLAECNILLERYNRLLNQYKADLGRLTLIGEGSDVLSDISEPTKCPYCDGILVPRKRELYKESVEIEVKKLKMQLSELIAAVHDTETQKFILETKLSKLVEERDTLKGEVQDKLRPLEEEQHDVINRYKAYLRITEEIKIIERAEENYDKDLINLQKKDGEKDKLEYRPKEYFDENFVTIMSKYAEEILSECNYDGLIKACFNFVDFDIEINGEDKAKSHGKGYRSYINTVMIMMLRKYLANHAKYNPCFFIIDTPLHGFDDGISDKMPNSMRSGLYQYFLNHQDEGQLIILENLDHIPHLEFEEQGATVITFTKNEESGKRYGFLNIKH